MTKTRTVRKALVLCFVILVAVGSVQSEDNCSKDICANDNCSNDARTGVTVDDNDNGCPSDSKSSDQELLSRDLPDTKCPLIMPTTETSADGTRCVDLMALS